MDKRVTRREALAKWTTVAAGVLTATLVPRQAQAANGDPLLLGQDNEATGRTKVVNSGSGAPAIEAETTGGDGPYEGAPPASIRGVTSGGGRGVLGMSSGSGDGVVGTSVSGIGVIGRSDSYVAVFGGAGFPDGPPPSDVRGVTQVGVYGAANGGWTGIMGSSTSGVGVKAKSTSGSALKVEGKASFSRSGRAMILAGRTYRDVNCSNLGTGSMILATLQGSGGAGVAVAYCARLSSTRFRIVLTKPTTRSVYVAWFVLN